CESLLCGAMGSTHPTQRLEAVNCAWVLEWTQSHCQPALLRSVRRGRQLSRPRGAMQFAAHRCPFDADFLAQRRLGDLRIFFHPSLEQSSPMAKLQLSLAIGDYDRTRPLMDGSVQIDGVDPVIMTLSPEEIFFRAFRHAEFDICELSLSSFAVQTATGECP